MNSRFVSALLFLRLLGLVYFCAFVSLLVQLPGLFGSKGISPIGNYLSLVEKAAGTGAYWQLPTIFWLSASDGTLYGACLTGCALALSLFFGFLPRLCAFFLWALYLSFLNADYVFLQFQWDNLLVESGFLAIFLAPNAVKMSVLTPSRPVEINLLFRWLLFRLMFCSGVVKLASGDPSWRDLTALSFHYLTQPLPNPIAYFAAKLPEGLHRLSTGGMFFIELVVPFFYFTRPSLRRLAGYLTIALQLAILLTGNYTYFNILTIILTLFLFEAPPSDSPMPSWILALLFFLFLAVGSVHIVDIIAGSERIPTTIRRAVAVVTPLRLINSYGLFAVMTTERREIALEGSADGKTWSSYEFRYKPGNLSDPPCIVAPHQPRLDWQMWFASLGAPRHNPWLLQLLGRLRQGSPDVLDLFATNPFPDAPPRFLRALLYHYEFTSLSEKKISGAWWKRRLIGEYIPSVEFREGSAKDAPSAEADVNRSN